MDPLALIHAFLDQTRPPATRAAEAKTLRHLFFGPYGSLAQNAVQAVLVDPTETAEVRQAALLAYYPAMKSRARLEQKLASYPESERLHQLLSSMETEQRRVTRQVGPDQGGQLQRDLERLQQRLTIPRLAALSRYGRDERVLAALTEAASHPDPAIREAALWGLGYLGELSTVRHALEDAVPLVRVAAAQVLGRYAARREDLAVLTSALADPDLDVRGAAQVALRHLGLRRQPSPPPTRPVVPPHLAARALSLQFPWVPFLHQVSWAAVQQHSEELPDAVIASSWLGAPGATEAQLVAAEQRLGHRLPPSFREFLRVSNGWWDPWLRRFLPVEQVERFWSRDPDLAQLWEQEGAELLSGRTTDLQRVLQISEGAKRFLYLLNPAVVTPAGEWEAWSLSRGEIRHHPPLLIRYPSFWDLLQEEYNEKGAPEPPAPPGSWEQSNQP